MLVRSWPILLKNSIIPATLAQPKNSASQIGSGSTIATSAMVEAPPKRPQVDDHRVFQQNRPVAVIEPRGLALTLAADAKPSVHPHVNAHGDDQQAGEVRCPLGHRAEPWRALVDLAHAERRNRSNRHQRNGQPDREAQHQHGAQRELLQLKAQQEHGNRRRARNKPAGQAEQSDLPVGHVPVRETPADVIGMRQLVRILVSLARHIQPSQLLMEVVMLVHIRLHERDVIAVDVPAVAHGQARHELVRFGNFLERFQIAVLLGETEFMARPVDPLGRHGNILRLPVSAPKAGQPPARRNAVLEYLQRDQTVPGIDFVPLQSMGMALMPMAVSVLMVVVMVDMTRAMLVSPGAPEHPCRDQHDDHPGRQLEIRLQLLRRDSAPQIHAAQADPPHYQGVRNGRGDAQQHSLPHRSADRDDERRHHRLGMAGLQSVQSTQQNGAGNKQPGVRRTLGDQIGEWQHG